ncbi:MAG TPA: TonB-dependent receptor [Panacibacter sp.]|nr:TonB-dependent receptor [Panacibacter sp.]HNP44889.1 TonB-dependent receptor [Panacibacter sp.]
MRLKIDCLAARLCAVFLLMFLAGSVFAQNKITGNVTSAKDKQPVAFATITVKGTNVATTSSATGDFAITVPAGKNTLVISSVGFEETEINIGSSKTFSVVLKEKVSDLNEIVVTGYTAQKKKEITGAVSVVNVKELKQMPAGTGEEALQGRASGLNVVSSGQPGAASDIRIRGITTFGNNQPLVIVDGVRGELHNINVSDVESIQVLKDASAAIYGVAGANGVIIVTTKKGKAGKAKVSYDGYYGVTTRGPGFDMANTQEEANSIWQQRINSGLQPGDEGWGSKQYGTGVTPVIPDYITPTGAFEGDPNTDPATYNINSNQITRANKEGTDWYKEITRNAPVQQHNISVSSGSDKSSYFFSFGYLNQQGIAKFQYNKRYSVRANTIFNVGKNNNIRIGENAYVFYQQNPQYGNQGEGSPFSVAFREDAIIPIYDIAGNFAGTKSQDLGNAQNPYANIYRSKDNKANKWDIAGNVFAEVDFLKHFTARTSFGGIVDNNYGFNFNFVGYENAEGNTGSNSFTEQSNYNSQWTWNNTLTYNNTFGEHNVRVLVGTEAVNYYGRNVTGTRSSYFSENPDYWILGAGTGTQSNDGGAYQSALWSQFAKLEYGYAGKYLLNASIRRDGSSVFAEDVRYGYFPSVSGAWRISQENFMKGVSFINDLKLRASWGKLGTAGNVPATNPYNLYSTRLGRSAYDISGSSFSPYAGFFRSNVGNPSTTWEGDVITNFGIDASILKNKVDFTIEWYKKKVSGLLYGAQGPQWASLYTGDANLPQVNIADNQNTGLDLSATYHANITKDLKLDVTGIFTSYNNQIVDIPGSGYFDGPGIRNVTIQRNQEGHPLGAFFGYEVIGLFQSADDVAKSPTQNGAKAGLFKYKDVDNNGKIDANDRTFLGTPHPDFTYGLNLSLSYKAVDFSAFFFGSKGNDIYNQTLYYTDFPDFFKGGIRREVAVNSWTPERSSSTIPAVMNTGSFSSDQATNSYFISKGSYFRCKQMQIGYNVSSSFLSRFGIEHLRIYAQGANLFTITKYQGLDPELQSTDPRSASATNFGIDQGNYPHTPSYLFGVNLNF